MPYEPVIDLEALLVPIPGENPAGENLLYAGLHDQIREARRSEDDLAQGDWEHKIKVADWRAVDRLASEALSSQTKDLQIGAWLAEAILKLHGFAGLRDGLKLMRGLIETFWDRVYPEAEDGDLDGRANALSFLDRQLAFGLKEAPITGSPAGRNLSYYQYEESRRFDIPERLEDLSGPDLERVTALKEQAAQEGRVTSEQWRLAKNASRRAFYEEFNELVTSCVAEYKALDAAMDDKFKSQTPGLGALRKSLDEVAVFVGIILKEKRLAEPDPADIAAPAGENAAAQTATESVPSGATGGALKGRQDALRRLAEVAEYFRRTEPHSPVAYLVQRAVRWGEMPLERWLEEVIKDPNVLAGLRDTLGIQSGGES
jgi:type VI secretion system protein ImpA